MARGDALPFGSPLNVFAGSTVCSDDGGDECAEQKANTATPDRRNLNGCTGVVVSVVVGVTEAGSVGAGEVPAGGVAEVLRDLLACSVVETTSSVGWNRARGIDGVAL